MWTHPCANNNKTIQFIVNDTFPAKITSTISKYVRPSCALLKDTTTNLSQQTKKCCLDIHLYIYIVQHLTAIKAVPSRSLYSSNLNNIVTAKKFQQCILLPLPFHNSIFSPLNNRKLFIININKARLLFLRRRLCQGFYFSRPTATEDQHTIYLQIFLHTNYSKNII